VSPADHERALRHGLRGGHLRRAVRSRPQHPVRLTRANLGIHTGQRSAQRQQGDVVRGRTKYCRHPHPGPDRPGRTADRRRLVPRLSDLAGPHPSRRTAQHQRSRVRHAHPRATVHRPVRADAGTHARGQHAQPVQLHVLDPVRALRHPRPGRFCRSTGIRARRCGLWRPARRRADPTPDQHSASARPWWPVS
jgi:hypothetical protein